MKQRILLIKVTKIESLLPFLSYEQKWQPKLSVQLLMFPFLPIQKDEKYALNFINL